jgi:hypothetical protein
MKRPAHCKECLRREAKITLLLRNVGQHRPPARQQSLGEAVNLADRHGSAVGFWTRITGGLLLQLQVTWLGRHGCFLHPCRPAFGRRQEQATEVSGGPQCYLKFYSHSPQLNNLRSFNNGYWGKEMLDEQTGKPALG